MAGSSSDIKPAPVLTLSDLDRRAPRWPTFRARLGAIAADADVGRVFASVFIAHLTDWYDWDRSDYAFTSPEAAAEFCRRHERSLVELVRRHYKTPENFLKAFVAGGREMVPHRDLYPDYASSDHWPKRANDISWFILHPAKRGFEIDHEEVLREHGCGKDFDLWIFEQRKKSAGPVLKTDCWCADLRAGKVPEAGFVHLENFEFPLPPKYLFITEQHDGSVTRGRCKVCGGTVLRLFVNMPGFGDSSSYYFSFPTDEELSGFNEKNYEDWVNSHCGIYCALRFCRFYATTRVHTLFFESS